jgi:hypothetical protein
MNTKCQLLLTRSHSLISIGNYFYMLAGVATVRDIFQAKTTTHRTTLAGYPNPLVRPLLAPTPPRRLKRNWTFDALS